MIQLIRDEWKNQSERILVCAAITGLVAWTAGIISLCSVVLSWIFRHVRIVIV